MNIEGEKGFFKPKLWRQGPEQRPNRRFHRATARFWRNNDNTWAAFTVEAEAACGETDGVNEKAPPERGLS
jgi:hypothetical protein